MRVESSVTTVSWIPSEAVTGPVLKGTFESGVHALRRPAARRHRRPRGVAGTPAGSASPTACRPGSRSRTAASSTPATRGGGLMGSTTVQPGQAAGHVRAGRAARPPPGSPSARTPRSASCRPPAVAPASPRRGGSSTRRSCSSAPPTVWTTLALTIRADGTSDFEVLGASKFPRHWVYDAEGKLAAKVGLANFKDWYRDAFGKHTPWGDAGLAGARHRGRDRARAPALGHDHVGRRAPRDPHGQAGEVPRPSRATRATRSSSCSTACCR